MHGLTIAENEILKLIEKYGCLKETQINRFFNTDKTLVFLNFLQLKGLITIKDGYIALRGLSPIDSVIKAFEVVLYFEKEMQDHRMQSYPFTLYFMKNNVIYDVAVIPPGSEITISAVINRSFSQKVIAVIDDFEQMKNLEIEKPVLFFIPGDTPKLFEKL